MALSSFIVEKVVDIGQRLYQRGLIAGTDGNISARLDENHIAITKSGISKGQMNKSDLVVIDNAGNIIDSSSTPSSETGMHVHLYKKRPEIGACVHAHPPYATAFAVAGIALDQEILPEVVLFVGDIALTDFAFPGTPAVAESLDPLMANHDAFLLKNHGLVTIGRDLDEAFNRMETVEHFARIFYLARSLGNVDTLARQDVEKLKTLRTILQSKAEERK